MYPPSLEGLQIQVPADPCSGGPFQYRREGPGFVLYSAGANGKDEGGVSMGDLPFVVRK